jgi:hypothetical protein
MEKWGACSRSGGDVGAASLIRPNARKMQLRCWEAYPVHELGSLQLVQLC